MVCQVMKFLSEVACEIRPKEPEDRRIQLTRAQMMMVRLVSQFVIPLIVILAGILVWLKRR